MTANLQVVNVHSAMLLIFHDTQWIEHILISDQQGPQQILCFLWGYHGPCLGGYMCFNSQYEHSWIVFNGPKGKSDLYKGL